VAISFFPSRKQKNPIFKKLPHLVCSQIWLNYFHDDGHFGYITTKSLKKIQSDQPSIYWRTFAKKSNNFYFFGK
jgi:hypothetical protein